MQLTVILMVKIYFASLISYMAEAQRKESRAAERRSREEQLRLGFVCARACVCVRGGVFFFYKTTSIQHPPRLSAASIHRPCPFMG